MADLEQEPAPQEAINDLVDEQFERIHPRLVGYVTDPRRRFEHREGATLAFSASPIERHTTLQDDEATRGFVYVAPANGQSRDLAGRWLLQGVMDELGVSEPVLEVTKSLAAGQLTIVSGGLRLSLKREEHPKNWNDYAMGDPWTWGDANGEYYKRGLRRHISAKVTLGFVDTETQDPVSTLEAHAKLATRFDRDETRFTASLKLGAVALDDLEVDAQSVSIDRPASATDIPILARVFHAAKDLRPRVSSIQAIEEMNRFYELVEAKKYEEARQLVGQQ